MIRSPLMLAVTAALAVSGCRRDEVAWICAATGAPDAGITAFVHDGAGGLVHLVSDPALGQVEIARHALAAPMAQSFWSDVQLTFGATANGEIAPCDGETVSLALVTFADGRTETRETRCADNAMARLVERIIAASTSALPETATVPDRLDFRLSTVAAACDLAHDRS